MQPLHDYRLTFTILPKPLDVKDLREGETCASAMLEGNSAAHTPSHVHTSAVSVASNSAAKPPCRAALPPSPMQSSRVMVSPESDAWKSTATMHEQVCIATARLS
eukprot:365270-Chlamydomonas_euryale.AAC.2